MVAFRRPPIRPIVDRPIPHVPISVAGQGGPMNHVKRIAPRAPSHVPRSRRPGRSHGPERRRRAARSPSCPARSRPPARSRRSTFTIDPVAVHARRRRTATSSSASTSRRATSHRLGDRRPSTLKPEIVSVTDAAGHSDPGPALEVLPEDRQGQQAGPVRRPRPSW